MKTIYKLAVALVLVGGMSACSQDYLDVKSHDKLVIDQYYNSETRIYEALIAAYQPLGWFDYTFGQYSPLPIVMDVMGDDIYPGGADQQDNHQYHLMFNYQAQPTQVCSSVWTVCYSGINRANCVAQYMPGVQDIDEATKAQYLAEAVVLRSFYYNILWKLWGNVVYYEQNLEAPTYLGTQLTADEVYENVITGLEGVLATDVLPMKQTNAALDGRVTWAMAAMLYTEMVMYQNDQPRYQQALGFMEKIINSGQYNLVADYASIWEPSGEWSEESIFEINYFSQGAYRGWTNPQIAGGTVFPRVIGINEISGSAKYQNGWGFSPLTLSAATMFDDNDTRKAASVYQPAVDEPGVTYTPRYEDTGYFPAKYLPRLDGTTGQIADADLNFNNNLRIYRFSETLLNAAELIARGASGTGSAEDYLGRVRTRAGLGSEAATVDNILKERHLEFLGEGKRYSDLVRSGQAASVLTPANEIPVNGVTFRTQSWTESKKYLPIPQSEIDAAQNTMTQNNY